MFRLFFSSSREEPQPRCVASLRSTALTLFAPLGVPPPRPRTTFMLGDDTPNPNINPEFITVSKAFEEARGRIKDSLAVKIHEAVFKQLDIEGPVGVPLSSTYRKEQETAYSQNPESSPIFRQLAFLKYGVTFRELIHRIDIEKSPVAQRHLMAVHRDYWRIQSGIRFEDLKLKFGLSISRF